MVVIPQCMSCKHVSEDGKRRESGECYLPCAAFPDGIPDEILANDVWHDHPYPGDHGIQFEAAKDAADVDSTPA